ncbi:Plant self-incompatibility S1 [Corchorus olitorius]|uniref:S-protein homolog n=1 Tax=Corchorus olitorius TaxID=93759 RepID=A0A1R3KQ61_9ROSI|nr:Plant self-incompatibility S1 [Corchorus olitorius]
MSYNNLAPFLCMLFLTCCMSQTLAVSDAEVLGATGINILKLKYTVHIMNGFLDNAKPLLVRCRSNDHYLGEHKLWKDGEYHFRFGVSWVRTTHFRCYFDWGSKNLYDITVFRHGVPESENMSCKHTGQCYWKTVEDGLYFSNNNQDWEKKFDWHEGPP